MRCVAQISLFVKYLIHEILSISYIRGYNFLLLLYKNKILLGVGFENEITI